jgi:hypothetical protein
LKVDEYFHAGRARDSLSDLGLIEDGGDVEVIAGSPAAAPGLAHAGDYQ